MVELSVSVEVVRPRRQKQTSREHRHLVELMVVVKAVRRLVVILAWNFVVQKFRPVVV